MSFGRVWLTALAACVVLVTGSKGQGDDAKPPFYEALKTICIDTRLDPARITDAVTRAGGTFRTGFTGHPAAAEIIVGGHNLTVSLRGEDVTGSRSHSQSVECAILSRKDESSSIPMIRKWVGIAPTGDNKDNKSGETHVGFTYHEVGETRVPILTDEDFLRAQAAGGVWTLTAGFYDYGADAWFTWETVKPVNGAPVPIPPAVSAKFDQFLACVQTAQVGPPSEGDVEICGEWMGNNRRALHCLQHPTEISTPTKLEEWRVGAPRIVYSVSVSCPINDGGFLSVEIEEQSPGKLGLSVFWHTP